jgi:hypothetical protein
MAFDKESARVATKVGTVSVRFTTELNADGTVNTEPKGSIHYQLLDAAGEEIRYPNVELWSHLSDAQKNSIRTFMGNIRTKLAAEVL